VRATAADSRSQARNRELALERLAAAIRAALARDRPRRPTAPTKASRERRLDAKRVRGRTKRLRRPPGDES
jgi:ribosome-associated protein